MDEDNTSIYRKNVKELNNTSLKAGKYFGLSIIIMFVGLIIFEKYLLDKPYWIQALVTAFIICVVAFGTFNYLFHIHKQTQYIMKHRKK